MQSGPPKTLACPGCGTPIRGNRPTEEDRDILYQRRAADSEQREQARREEAKIIRARAIDRGLATMFNVNKVIYYMDARAFRELARDFPALSRVYFHPDRKKRNNRRPQ